MKFFYPGSIWAKRLARVLILFTIGANLFMAKLQDTLFEVGKDMISIADDLSRPAADAAVAVEKHILPFLEHVQSTTLGRQAMDRFGLPDTQDLYEGMGRVHGFRHALKEYAPYFSVTAKIIRFTSFLFWIPIGLACMWLGFDLFKSGGKSARMIVLAGLLLAIPINILMYQYLNTLFLSPGQTDFALMIQALH